MHILDIWGWIINVRAFRWEVTRFVFFFCFDMYFKQSGFDGLFSGNYTECSSGTDDCVKFRVTMGDSNFKVETRGKADNNGGYGLSRFMSSSFNVFIKEHITLVIVPFVWKKRMRS